MQSAAIGHFRREAERPEIREVVGRFDTFLRAVFAACAQSEL